MIKINKKKIDLWSNIGSRATFGLAALELEKKIKELFVVTCDVSTSAGLDRFRKQVPHKYVDVGISEQNMIGVASGLSTEGFKVITTTFAPFQTLRCCEQIKVNQGYMKTKIVMVGLASGLVLGALGFTHCSIEEVGVLRSIPNLAIVSPADSLEVVKSLEAALNYESSVYIRLTGGSQSPIVNSEDYKFEIGKAIKLTDGDDVTIFSCGAMVHNSLEAALILKKNDISCRVVNMHTIKPVDVDSIKESAKFSKLIVTVEEHNIIGGLGSAISEELTKIKDSPKLLRIGINDKYNKGGSYTYLQKIYELLPEQISNKIIKNLT